MDDNKQSGFALGKWLESSKIYFGMCAAQCVF